MSKSPKALLPSSLSFSSISRAAAQHHQSLASATTSTAASPASPHPSYALQRHHRVRTYVSSASQGYGQCVVIRQRKVHPSPSPRSNHAPSATPAASDPSALLRRSASTSVARRQGGQAPYVAYGSSRPFSTTSPPHQHHAVSHPSSLGIGPSGIVPPPPGSPTSAPAPSSKHHASLTGVPHSTDASLVLPTSPSSHSSTPPSVSRTGPDASSSSSSTSNANSSPTNPPHASLLSPSASHPSSRTPPHALPSFFGSSSLSVARRGNLTFRNGAYGIPKNTDKHTMSRAGAKGKEKMVEPAPGMDEPEHCLSVSVGEDSYFLRADSLGVADGVGGWSKHAGANPARWARKFMHHCSAELARYENIDDELFLQYYEIDPVEVMQLAFEKCLSESKDEGIIGSSTALLAILRNDELRLANLGDCYCCVIRDNDYVFRSEEQQHSFNFPFQAGTNSKDTPIKDAQRIVVKVQKDDIVLLASDGLVDNVFSDDLLEEVLRFVSTSPSPSPSPVSASSASSSSSTSTSSPASSNGQKRYTLNRFSPQLVAESLCYRAKSVYDDPRAVASPFQNRAVEEGLYYAGGKRDDVTCLIGVVGELEASPNRRDVA
ncbi:hypothetical protein JCM10212_007085 [Sporobolomyces blumeae]